VGIGTEQTWAAIRSARSGISAITAFDATLFSCRIAGEIREFQPTDYIERKELKKMGRFIQFAIAASDFALAASGLKVTAENAERVGVYIGSGIGGFEVIEREFEQLLAHGPKRISPFFIPATIVNLASGFVSIRVGAKGPNSATATACTTSAHAIGDSFRMIQRGDADAMLCGGTEATICRMGIGGFAAMRALSTRNDEPERASRPWDKGRDGFVVGEGAGILVLEELELAKRRGAPILAEVAGYGMSGDAFHITAPAEDGDGAFRVMRNALADAGIQPTDVQYINAHGTSTPVGDRVETIAMKRCFGEYAYKLAVSSTKSMTGHLLAGRAASRRALPCWPFATRLRLPPSTTTTPTRIATWTTFRIPRGDAHPVRALEFLWIRRHQRVPDLQTLFQRVAARPLQHHVVLPAGRQPEVSHPPVDPAGTTATSEGPEGTHRRASTVGLAAVSFDGGLGAGGLGAGGLPLSAGLSFLMGLIRTCALRPSIRGEPSAEPYGARSCAKRMSSFWPRSVCAISRRGTAPPPSPGCLPAGTGWRGSS